MHYYALAVIPNDAGDVEAAVAAVMEPYRESDTDEDHDGWWDWWQIGGRYTGRLDGYNPLADPRNNEVCRLCAGTGTRRYMDLANGCNGCNGCNGTGTARKWPTEWVDHPGDVGTVAQADAPPFTLIWDGGYASKETWNGQDFVDETGKLEAAWSALPAETRVVVVDYHG